MVTNLKNKVTIILENLLYSVRWLTSHTSSKMYILRVELKQK